MCDPAVGDRIFNVTVHDLNNVDYRPNQNMSASILLYGNRTTQLAIISNKGSISTLAIIGIILGGVFLGTFHV